MITIFSILFAVFFALLMRSMQRGSYANMVENVVGSYFGYIQIHGKDYWEKKTIEESMSTLDFSQESVLAVANVVGLIPRLESFALASSGSITKGVLLAGIAPEAENTFTNLSGKLIAGDYLFSGDDGVMLAEKLASYLKLEVADTLVMISQGYHGVSAAGKYPVKGILRFSSPELNKLMVYLNLEYCQEFFGAEDRLSAFVVMLEDHGRNMVSRTRELIRDKLSNGYEVMSWREMMPELVQLIESDNASGLIMLGILYMIIAFGILGTVMMMTTERVREFGVMIAVGMQRLRLAGVVFLETIYVGIIGICAGSIMSVPVVYYMHHNPIRLSGDAAKSMESFGVEPIIPFAWEISFFINQAFIVFIITLITGLYPLYKVLRLQPVKALKSRL